MASIIRQFEYDVFISYRQKDNKGDKWVNEFVEALRTELDSTFKEEISVYFDVNPHDGLLETYDVDASLKDKLNCLIFIPIISRTYCDPKSFAWENEFKAFIRQAAQDQFGIKVKLPNGNVASRIIPVQIHDLYAEDKTLIEKELGGALRAIDFIYKEPGVNRPLTSTDDKELNLNRTKYRNQINKVAHAIDEVIYSLKATQYAPTARKLPVENTVAEVREEADLRKLYRKLIMLRKSKTFMVPVILMALLFIGAFTIFKIAEEHEKARDIDKLEKSIAVLPFLNDSPDKENTFFINGIMEEILGNLQKIKDFRVLSRTSTDQYKDNTRPSIPEIANKLGVSYLVEGSGQKYGNTIRLRVKLIEGVTGKELWAEPYEKEIHDTKETFSIQSSIAKSIAEALKAEITPEEKELIEQTPTRSLTAYDFYRQGFEELMKYGPDGINIQSVKKAEALFHYALEYDSTYSLAYTGLANAFWKEYYLEQSSHHYLDSMLIMSEIALSYNNKLAEAYFVRGGYYFERGDATRALNEWDKAIRFNPNSWHAYWGKGFLYNYYYDDQIHSIENFQKAASVNHGSELPTFLTSIGHGYCQAGFPEKGKYFLSEALKLNADTINYLNNLAFAEEIQGDFQKAARNLEKINLTDSTNTDCLKTLGYYYLMLGKYKESLKYYERYISGTAKSGQSDQYISLYIGYSYLQNGFKKKAEYYFDKQTEDSNYNMKFSASWWDIYKSSFTLAGVYALRGEKARACEILKTLMKQKSDLMWLSAIKNNPLFSGIRNEPEFKQIVSELEDRYLTEHEKMRKWMEEREKI
jgi:TolB-like protein/Tfp pilus assembly protein PilF